MFAGKNFIIIIALKLLFGQSVQSATNFAALGLDNQVLLILDLDNNRIIRSFPRVAGSQWTWIKMLKDGRVAAQSNVGDLNIWNIITGQADLTLPTIAYSIEQLADGSLVTGTNEIKVWNLTDGTLIKTIIAPSPQYFLKQTSVDNCLASGASNGDIFIWNLDTSTAIQTLIGHTAEISIMQLTSDGMLVSGSFDGFIRIWNFLSGECLKVYKALSGVNGMKILQGNLLAIVTPASQLEVVEITSSYNINSVETINLNGYANDVRITRSNILLIALKGGYVAYYNWTDSTFIKTESWGEQNEIYYLEIDDPLPVVKQSQSSSVSSGRFIKIIANHTMPYVKDNMIDSFITKQRFYCLSACQQNSMCQAATYDVRSNCSLYLNYASPLQANLVFSASTNFFYKN